MQTEVFLDLDGTLVNLVQGLCRYHKIPNPYYDAANLGRYDIRHIVGFSQKAFWGVLDHDFWVDLEWMPDGRAILAEILKYVDIKHVTILTAPTGFSGCIEGKISWVNKELPGVKYFVGNRKEAIAAPTKLLIDDHDDNIDAWIGAGGPAIQVPRPSNRLHPISTLNYVKTQLKTYFKGVK